MNFINSIKCFMNMHSYEYETIREFGTQYFVRTCTKCGKVQVASAHLGSCWITRK